MHPYFPFLMHSYFPKIEHICFLVTGFTIDADGERDSHISL